MKLNVEASAKNDYKEFNSSAERKQKAVLLHFMSKRESYDGTNRPTFLLTSNTLKPDSANLQSVNGSKASGFLGRLTSDLDPITFRRTQQSSVQKLKITEPIYSQVYDRRSFPVSQGTFVLQPTLT